MNPAANLASFLYENCENIFWPPPILRQGFYCFCCRLFHPGRLLAGPAEGAAAAGSNAAPGAGSLNNLQSSGERLRAHLRRGNPPAQPLDTMVLFERGDENNGNAITHEVLSLIHQEKGKDAYPWTLYASLETHHENGDACVECARLHKHGPGWSSGLHSEVFNHARGVALGVNIEMSNDAPKEADTTAIGLNIQAVGGTKIMQHGIQIHDGANHFDTAIHLAGEGKRGMDLSGNFQVGINLGKNSVRLNEGSCVELEEQGRIKVRYLKGRIEFLNGDKCFGHLDVNGTDHAL